MAIRIPLALIGVISFGIGITLLVEGKYHPMIVYLAVAAVIAIVGVVFDRQGYFQRTTRSTGRHMSFFEKEHFIDPETGHLIEVRYNPITGQERYVDQGDGKAHE